MAPRYSIITTCKGRLHHLKRSLPAMVAQPDSEVIVVDYACPDHTWQWIEATFPTVRVVKVTGIDGFHLADARNRGAAIAQGERLAFIDADVILAEHFFNYIDKHMAVGSLGSFSQPKFGGARDKNIKGTIVVFKRDFEFIGGYDDVFHDWGWEDVDLVMRLVEEAQLDIVLLPYELISETIEHSDTERVKFYERSVTSGYLIGYLYRQLKDVHTRLTRVPPSREQRLAFHREARRIVDLVEKEQRPEMTIRYDQKGIAGGYGWEFDLRVFICGRRLI